MSIVSSSLASIIASLIYFVSSYFFDKEISPNKSNIISSVLSVSSDVILQSYFFKKQQTNVFKILWNKSNIPSNKKI